MLSSVRCLQYVYFMIKISQTATKLQRVSSVSTVFLLNYGNTLEGAGLCFGE